MLWQIFVVAFVVAGKHGCEALIGKIAITNSDVLESYADGSALPTYTGVTGESGIFAPNDAPKLLAFHAHITAGTTAGILASFNTGVKTDTNFRCETLETTNPDIEVEGWKDVGFDDSNWPAAVIIEQNTESAPAPFTHVDTVASAASWIWTSDVTGKDIICRVSPIRCVTSHVPRLQNYNSLHPASPQRLELPDGTNYLTLSNTGGTVDGCMFTPCFGQPSLTPNQDFLQAFQCCTESGWKVKVEGCTNTCY